MNRPDGWGPSHQTEARRRWIARPPVLLFAVAVGMLVASAIHYGFTYRDRADPRARRDRRD